MTSTRKFPNDPASVRAARQFALRELAGHAPELLEVVQLLVSELATNSVLHTDTDFSLRIDDDPERIRIAVTDHGSGRPEVQGLDPEALSGRGLALVETFSSSWGVRPSRSAAGGKTVWLVLEVTKQRLLRGASACVGDHHSGVSPKRNPAVPRRKAADDSPPAPGRRGVDRRRRGAVRLVTL